AHRNPRRPSSRAGGRPATVAPHAKGLVSSILVEPNEPGDWSFGAYARFENLADRGRLRCWWFWRTRHRGVPHSQQPRSPVGQVPGSDHAGRPATLVALSWSGRVAR